MQRVLGRLEASVPLPEAKNVLLLEGRESIPTSLNGVLDFSQTISGRFPTIC